MDHGSFREVVKKTQIVGYLPERSDKPCTSVVSSLVWPRSVSNNERVRPREMTVIRDLTRLIRLRSPCAFWKPIRHDEECYEIGETGKVELSRQMEARHRRYFP